MAHPSLDVTAHPVSKKGKAFEIGVKPTNLGGKGILGTITLSVSGTLTIETRQVMFAESINRRDDMEIQRQGKGV